MQSRSSESFLAILVLFSLGLTALPIQAQTSTPVPTSNSVLLNAITKHGGDAVGAVRRIRIEGQSATPAGTTPVIISADLDGSIRMDYGNPVTRSIVNTTQGAFTFQNNRREIKPPHVGVFAQLDMLSIFGVMRLETGSWSDLGSATVGGRNAANQRANSGQSQEQYRRVLADQADIQFDVETGLLSAITRTHYGEKSVDLAMPVTYVFSDHRTVTNVVFPFRIERYLNATLMEVITVTKVELNPPISPAIFER